VKCFGDSIPLGRSRSKETSADDIAIVVRCRFIWGGFSLLASNTLGSNRISILRYATRQISSRERNIATIYSQFYIRRCKAEESAQLRPKDVRQETRKRLTRSGREHDLSSRYACARVTYLFLRKQSSILQCPQYLDYIRVSRISKDKVLYKNHHRNRFLINIPSIVYSHKIVLPHGKTAN